MRRLYPTLLLLSTFLTTFGQTSQVSLSDNKEFEGTLVRVFEWVLDGRFSPAQRSELSRLVDSSAQSGNPADLQSLQDVARLNDLIDSIPPDKQAETHAAIQAKILEQLRKQPTDPTARLLLAVYDNGHSVATSNFNSTPTQPAEDVRTVRSSSVPPELVGEWLARRGSGSSYFNPNTGAHGAPNATIDSYKFFSDGRYEHAILMQNSLYNCTIRVFGRETGEALVAGNTLTITPSPGTLEYQDNCRPHLNSKKVTQMDGEKWQWQVGRDQQGVKLCVRDEKGASACYYRQ